MSIPNLFSRLLSVLLLASLSFTAVAAAKDKDRGDIKHVLLISVDVPMHALRPTRIPSPVCWPS